MTIQEIIRKYVERNPHQKNILAPLLTRTVKPNSDDALTDRNNSAGHVTSSVILIARKTHRMLQLSHPKYNLFLQPGSHIASGMNPLSNVKRILKSERLQGNLVGEEADMMIPIDIDVHGIPKDEEKGEDEHTHYDFRYLAACEDEFEMENSNYRWQDIQELKESETFKHLIDKVQLLWSREYEETLFYRSIVNSIDLPEAPSFLVVQHILPGVKHFLRSLESLGKVLAVIPKPKSIDLDTLNSLKGQYYIVDIPSREELGSSKEILDILNNAESRVILIDIGGWFTTVIGDWNQKYLNRIIGIVEDTENGHQKYQNLGDLLPLPVISVARSPLKLNEDSLIGQSIVFSSDFILRQQNKLLKYMQCGVLGYGKVGKSIAADLLAESIKPIVYDTDPLKLIEAYNCGCSIGTKETVLSSSDAIFCATGNKSLDLAWLAKVKRGAYIFSVTSADDEFDFSGISKEYRSEKISDNTTRFYKFENSFYLVNDGNAVNFMHNAVVVEFIHLVKAEMLTGIKYLFKLAGTKRIGVVPKQDQRAIAKKWLEYFHQINSKD